jgi:two-component system, NtrC family, sensor histidine kinase HydH
MATIDSEPRPEDSAERLREQITEIATLAGGLAHEIRNPIGTLNLNLQLLAEDFRNAADPRQQRAMRKIVVLQEECLRLQKILDDFLRFVRLTGLKLEADDLNEIMQDLADFFGAQAARDDIVIRTSPAPDLPACRVDRDTLHQAMLNLMINADHAMPDGGELLMRTSAETCDGRQWVRLDITDTGRGMDAETLQRAFSPFYSTKAGGSGLGLPTARKIVEAHAGTLQAQSEPGRGTIFSIRLPVWAPDTDPEFDAKTDGRQ